MMRDGQPAIVSRQKTSLVLVRPASRQLQANGRPVFVVGINNLSRGPIEFRVAEVEANQRVGASEYPMQVVTFDRAPVRPFGPGGWIAAARSRVLEGLRGGRRARSALVPSGWNPPAMAPAAGSDPAGARGRPCAPGGIGSSRAPAPRGRIATGGRSSSTRRVPVLRRGYHRALA